MTKKEYLVIFRDGYFIETNNPYEYENDEDWLMTYYLHEYLKEIIFKENPKNKLISNMVFSETI